MMTATTPTSLDGSLGCQEEAMLAEDCFGLQPDLILRIAVIDTDAGPLLIWVRDIRGADDRELEYESFDDMLASVQFRPDAEPTTVCDDRRPGFAHRRRLDDEPDPRRAGEPTPMLYDEGDEKHLDGDTLEFERDDSSASRPRRSSSSRGPSSHDGSTVTASSLGISAATVVPPAAESPTTNLPPSASTRSARPSNPVPRDGSTPPTPSSTTLATTSRVLAGHRHGRRARDRRAWRCWPTPRRTRSTRRTRRQDAADRR